MTTAAAPPQVRDAAGPPAAASTPGPLLLDPWAARSCPVKTQHRLDPSEAPLPAVAAEPDDPLVLRAEAARRHRAVVLESLIDRCAGRVADLRLLAADGPDAQTAATRRALEAGVDVVVGGVLPPDHDAHRSGAPDLLVRGVDDPAGRPTYHPALVVWHQVLTSAAGTGEDEDAPGLPWTPFAQPSPADLRRRVGVGLRVRSEERDLRQLAHHHRLLQAAGFGGATAWGGLVGTDAAASAEHDPFLTWCDLGAPLLRAPDPDAPGASRLETVLERYDGAFARRLEVATAVRQGVRLLEPVVVRECATCPWWERCRARLDDDDVSVRIDRGALDRTEVETLRGLGTGTVHALAAADLDALLPRYLPQVLPRRAHAEDRLRTAARRARLLVGGVPFVRETSGPIEVPGATVEVDLDIESSADGRVYLWGFWVERPGDADAGPGEYVAFAAFRDLDEAAETALAVEAFTWLRDLVDAGPSVAVYHYSGYEPSTIDTLARRSGHPVLAWATAYAQEGFVDLLDVVKEHWFGVGGLGLKLVATHAGFAWRDEDPGGLNSQRWFADAVHDPDPGVRAAATRRVLAYNEDDVLATRHVRAWLREAR